VSLHSCRLAIFVMLDKANAAPVGEPWMWTLAFGHPATREAALAAFAKSWRRE
jgi:hypothetical protein